MRIIKPKEKDTFDKLCKLISIDDKEKYQLLASYLLFTKQLNESGSNKIQSFYLNTFGEHVKSSIETINKELDILNKMLHYLQLLLTNNKYHYYTDSYYYDYFEEVIKFIAQNINNRNMKTTVTMVAVRMGIKTSAPEVTIAGDKKAIENLLTDDIYQNILNKIPRR